MLSMFIAVMLSAAPVAQTECKVEAMNNLSACLSRAEVYNKDLKRWEEEANICETNRVRSESACRFVQPRKQLAKK